MKAKPRTLGELRQSRFSEERIRHRTVKDEIRENLICRLDSGGRLFEGIVGFDDTVIPQITNAILSRHNFILLGLRGQAKTRLLRALVTLLDEELAVLAGCEINDNPYAPICRSCRLLLEEKGEAAPVDSPAQVFPPLRVPRTPPPSVHILPYWESAKLTP